MVSIGPEDHDDHPARDPRALASGRLPSVLALEIPPCVYRKPDPYWL